MRAITRRQAMKGAGLAGLGAFVSIGHTSESRAALAAAESEVPTTTIRTLSGEGVELATEGLTTSMTPPGTRVAACLLVSGGHPQAGGPGQSISAVGHMSVSAAGIRGAAVEALGTFEPDRGVEGRVYRLLDALDVPRPVKIYAFQSRVQDNEGRGLEGGQKIQLLWKANTRYAEDAVQGLAKALETYHGWIFGEIADSGLFRTLHYMRVEKVRV